MPAPVYDKLAARYDAAFAPCERRFLARWRREAMAQLPENARLLEIGAGTGLNFQYYPAHKHSVAGELSGRMLEIAAQKEIAGLSLVQLDAQSLPFKDNSFDAAFATLVFCSVPEPARAFAELRRVVKDGGRIVLLEHVRPPGVLGYFFDLLNLLTVRLIDDHFNRRTAELAAAAGLRVIEVKSKAFGIVNLIICEIISAK